MLVSSEKRFRERDLVGVDVDADALFGKKTSSLPHLITLAGNSIDNIFNTFLLVRLCIYHLFKMTAFPK